VVSNDPRRATDVEERAGVRAADERPDELGTLARIFALLILYRPRIDQPAMKGTHEWTIHAVVKTAVRLRGHARIEKHKATSPAGMRLGRIAVSVAMREDDELDSTAEIARGHRTFRLRGVVVVERGDPFFSIRR
jgi:hypothetical protein